MQSSAFDQRFRPEVQGLRAVAVLLVIGYHLEPGIVPGGYVGVDVFFVISGFLITAHLEREVRTTGRVRLTAFWERRARRLLPSALFVLAVCLGLVVAVVPTTLWDQTLRQVVASTFYWQNWALASDAVTYSASGNTATLVQHYWSLSVEEQFYLLWPVVVLLVAVAVRRRGVDALQLALVGVLTCVAAGSLAWSVALTRSDPAAAYFVTQTRVWELGAGALLAVGSARWGGAIRQHARRDWAPTVGWCGLAAIAAAALSFTEATPFPGWRALLPVLGAVAVIWAGRTTSAFAASRPLSSAPMQFIGNISYAAYLWHWPLVVSLRYLTGEPPSNVGKLAVLLGTGALAWLTTRFVEQPVRARRTVSGRRWQALGVTALAMAVVTAGTLHLQSVLDRRVAADQQQAETALQEPTLRGCIGPAALDPDNECGEPEGRGPLLVSPETVSRQNTVEAYPGCQGSQDSPEVVSCSLGEGEGASREVAIVGDSHATMWFPALDRLGRERSWRVHTWTRSSCPFSLALRALPASEADSSKQSICAQGNRSVLRNLRTDDSIDLVFVAAYTSAYDWLDNASGLFDDPATDGFRAAWSQLVASGKTVVVLRDVPVVKDRVNPPDCLLANNGQRSACTLPRSAALPRDGQASAASAPAIPGVHVIDATDQFCDDITCYTVVGDVIAYRDFSHLSDEYARLLTPFLARYLDAAGLG